MQSGTVDAENKAGAEAPRDATSSEEEYRKFYDELAECFPEAELTYRGYKGRTRFEVIMETLAPLARRGSRLLDIGCSEGTYTIPFARMGGKAHGIEISPRLVETAIERAKEALPGNAEISFDVGDVYDLERFRSKFDAVLFSEVFEHVNDQERAMREIAGMLRPGSVLLLTTPTPLFEAHPRLDTEYVRMFLSGRLKEEFVIDTSESKLSDFGVERTFYRHDGFYPIPLRRFVESFGFKCLRMTTCTPLYPQDGGLYGRTLRILARPRPRRLVSRLPLLNLFGQTNVQVFKRR